MQNRLAATLLLAACCLLLQGAPAAAQAPLQEHSLSDAPAKAPAAAPPAASTPPAATPAVAGGASVAPAPPPPPAPEQNVPPAAPVAPAPAPVPSPPPAAAGRTPINGQTAVSPPASPGATPINGQTSFSPPPPPPPPPPTKAQTYNRAEVNREVMGFFESGSRGLAEIVARAFRDQGEPTGFIKGNEAGGALVVGFRYGTGTLFLKGQKPIIVYWQSPSLGIDLGVNAGKVFTLVYGTTNPNEIFQRFPGVNGSAYIIGGFGMTYLRSEGITLAPIRVGVGLRLGANVGYQHYTRTQDINPF